MTEIVNLGFSTFFENLQLHKFSTDFDDFYLKKLEIVQIFYRKYPYSPQFNLQSIPEKIRPSRHVDHLPSAQSILRNHRGRCWWSNVCILFEIGGKQSKNDFSAMTQTLSVDNTPVPVFKDKEDGVFIVKPTGAR